MRALPGDWRRTRALADGRQTKLCLNDHRRTFYGPKILAQAYHSGHDPISRPDVHQQHVILIMMDDSVEEEHQFGLALRTHAALEHGVLEPFSVAVHDLEDASPSLRIGDIVSDDIEPLVMHGLTLL